MDQFTRNRNGKHYLWLIYPRQNLHTNTTKLSVYYFKVAYIIVSLVEGGLDAQDIGVIAPYALQVRLLEKQLTAMGIQITKGKVGDYTEIIKEKLSKVKVGTVKEFQGLDRQIIVVSTTRTCSQNVEIDFARQLDL